MRTTLGLKGTEVSDRELLLLMDRLSNAGDGSQPEVTIEAFVDFVDKEDAAARLSFDEEYESDQDEKLREAEERRREIEWCKEILDKTRTEAEKLDC